MKPRIHSQPYVVPKLDRLAARRGNLTLVTAVAGR